MLMGSETLEEIVEQEAINETYRSKTLTYLAKHPMVPLVNRRTLRWNIATIVFTFVLLGFAIVCSRIISRNSSLVNPHGIYSQLEFAFSGTRTTTILQSLNSTGMFALGVQNGIEFAKSVMYAIVLMLLLLSVAKRLQSDKRCHVSRNGLFIKANKAMITLGFILAWLVIIPCFLHTISHWFIFAQLVHGAGKDGLSVLTGICLLAFYIAAIGMGGIYIILVGLYSLVLMFISKRRGYYFHSSPLHH